MNLPAHQSLESLMKIRKTLNLVIVKRDQSSPEGIISRKKCELFLSRNHPNQWKSVNFFGNNEKIRSKNTKVHLKPPPPKGPSSARKKYPQILSNPEKSRRFFIHLIRIARNFDAVSTQISSKIARRLAMQGSAKITPMLGLWFAKSVETGSFGYPFPVVGLNLCSAHFVE